MKMIVIYIVVGNQFLTFWFQNVWFRLQVCIPFVFSQGGAFPYTIGRISHGFDVRPDLCAVENNFSPR
jgi:hypothetical protein